MDTEAENKYEIMLILSSELGDSGTEKALNELRETIFEFTGSIFQEDIWGIRDLSYRIKKEDQGFYALFYTSFEETRKLKDLEKSFNLNADLLRSLVIKIDKNHIIRTLEQYSDDARILEEEEEKKEAEKKAKQESRAQAKPAAKPAPKPAAKPVSKPKKEVEEKKAPVSTKAEEEESKSKLDAVDEKLKNLIDDPDITL